MKSMMTRSHSENYSRIGLRFAHSPTFSTKAHEMKEPAWSNWHEL